MKMTKSPSSVIPTARRPTGLPSKVQMLTGLAAWNVFSDGSSLREVAVALQEVGCTDAIVFGENYHSPVVIRDDNRGIPLGKVAGRYDWETNGNVKNADNEASSQSWIMFK